MHSVLTFIADGFEGRAFLMAWEVWGALVFGFAIYAEIAIAKSLAEKGASAASALAFQFGSTNLVISQVCLGT